MKHIININDNWLFTKDDMSKALEKSEFVGEETNLPHTWNASGGAKKGDYHRGICWYRKVFDYEYRKRKVFIEFKGSNSVTEVFINSHFAGRHEGGYSCFRFEITDFLQGTSNEIIVKVDNTVTHDVYPIDADFIFYGGIYRDVNIIVVDELYFELMDYGSSGIYITPQIKGRDAVIDIASMVCGKIPNASAEYCIIDDQNEKICILHKPPESHEFHMSIRNAKLWRGKDSPYLYTLRARLFSLTSDEIYDEVEIKFGVRYFRVESETGFYLNNKPYRLNGVSRHQDRDGLGNALLPAHHKEDMELIKELGASSIRLVHYQHSEYFYNLCNTEGMVVWAEIPFGSKASFTKKAKQNAISQLIELIKQNYNHPSVCFWGVQNEITKGGSSLKQILFVKKLERLAKKLDKKRLTVSANLATVSDTSPYNHITDLVGFNKYYGYGEEANKISEWMDTFHKKNKKLKLCMSEYGADGRIEEDHTSFHERVWIEIEKRPFIWASYVSNMFDYGSDSRNEGEFKGRNNKGLVSFDRIIKKDAFYYYKMEWSNEKFVHICGKRFQDRVTDKTTLKVYASCARISVYVNGNFFITQNNDKNVFEFLIDLKMGENRITVNSEYGCGDTITINRVEKL